MGWVALALGLLAVAALLYWQLVLAEGAYLGRRVVAWLYDRSAHAYDDIKAYKYVNEVAFLGAPLSRALAEVPEPWVLDVGAGTARLARALLPEPGFAGRVVSLDISREMLTQAATATERWRDRAPLVWQGATALPFDDAAFDAVTCLGALELMPDPDRALAEMVRVLRPGGALLISNRVGVIARWMPGRAMSSEAFAEKLRALSLTDVRVRRWMTAYNLLWAVKPGVPSSSGVGGLPRALSALLRCPACGGPVSRGEVAFRCAQGHVLPVAEDGVIEMLEMR